MHSDFKNIEYMYHKPYLCHQAEKVHNIKNMFIPITRWVQHGLE